jgi:beta-galactosidase
MKAEQSFLALGVCDYPEHVPQTDWQSHAKMQRELGLTWVRLAEFSWAKLEPKEGQYQWQWLDEAIDVYHQHGLQVVLGTPTATPPAWLLEKYPEILPFDENGLQKKFGSRRHYDHASEVYRQFCQRIVEDMAVRYADHPAVVGWQIDNELGHEGTTVSYGGVSESRFPNWLANKYSTLDALNQAWGNAFWSQDYSDWSQIKAPNLTAVRQANPSHALDYQRFCSDMIDEFQQLQIDLLRRICPKHFITHNYVIFSAESDLYKLAKPLDFVAWDSYPIGMLEYFATWESEETKIRFARTGHPDLVSLNHDIYRGLKQGEKFWVMEQQCGHANWAQYNPLPADGAVKLWTAQAWAHGAKGVVYFRFRASHMAQEIMHSGLRMQNGQADRGWHEVSALDTQTFPLCNSRNRVAILHDYDALWAYNLQPHHQKLSYWHQFVLFYSVVRSLGVDVDIIAADQLPQNTYDVVICPALTLINPTAVAHLKQAALTSRIIFGPRTDVRDDAGKFLEQGQMQNLWDITGVKGKHFDSLRPGLTQKLAGMDNHFEADYWCECYEVSDAEILYRYSDGPMANQPAVTRKNNVTTVGALSNKMLELIIAQELEGRGIKVEAMPEGVRKTQVGDSTLIVNFNEHSVNWHNHEIGRASYLIV